MFVKGNPDLQISAAPRFYRSGHIQNEEQERRVHPKGHAHWSDRVWGHLCDGTGDVDRINSLLYIRELFAKANSRKETESVGKLFEEWEEFYA